MENMQVPLDLDAHRHSGHAQVGNFRGLQGEHYLGFGVASEAECVAEAAG